MFSIDLDVVLIKNRVRSTNQINNNIITIVYIKQIPESVSRGVSRGCFTECFTGVSRGVSRILMDFLIF